MWTWGAEPLVAGLPQTELRPPDEARNDRAVGLVGETRGFIGGVAMWSSHERLADGDEFKGAERDWFIYYSTTTKLHTNVKRHFFVTAEQRLLSELREVPRQQYWQRGRVVSVGADCGSPAKSCAPRSASTMRLPPATTHGVSVYSLNCYLGPELAPSRVRLHRWLEGRTVDVGREAGGARAVDA